MSGDGAATWWFLGATGPQLAVCGAGGFRVTGPGRVLWRWGSAPGEGSSAVLGLGPRGSGAQLSAGGAGPCRRPGPGSCSGQCRVTVPSVGLPLSAGRSPGSTSLGGLHLPPSPVPFLPSLPVIRTERRYRRWRCG